jgi:serine/threonine protein kinase
MVERLRYLKAKEIFQQAVETNPRDREQYVASACAGDDALRQDVLRMLSGDLQADDNWEETVRAQIAEHLNASGPTGFPPYPVGEILGGRYFIQRHLGEGGIGAVYLASDKRLYLRPVLVKVLLEASSRNQHLVDKFKHEGEALARIKHSGVVKVYDLGELPDGKPYLVMEFVEGKMLADEMHAGAMGFQRAASFVRQIAQALFAAHYEGIVHRDLKPPNVMIQKLSGGTEQAKLIDFGIAKLANPVSADATQAPVIIGTPAYMAPEQIEKGEASPASDIYALGVMAYEMLTAHRPFNVDTTSLSWPIELVNQQRAGVSTKPKELRADLPDAAQEEILRALEYNPEHRHQQAFEFAEGLYRALMNQSEIEPLKIDLASVTLDLGSQPSALTFSSRGLGAKPANRAVESFERLWSNATFSDRIWPVTLEFVNQQGALQQGPGMGKKSLRGLGSKPRRVQYAYPLGSELCLTFDIKRGGYLTLLDEGPEGIVYCLCPSRFAPDSLLEAGRFYFPQEGSSFRAFELSGAAGKEKLLAIISDEPLGLDWLPKDAETPSRELSSDDIESLFARLQRLGEGRWTALSSYFEVTD